MIWLKAGLFVFFMSIIAGGAFGVKYYIDSNRETIKALAANNAILQSSYEAQTAALEQAQLQAKKQSELNNELTVNLQKANDDLNDLRQKLTNHDLTKLALARPGLIENRINSGTKDVFEQIEKDTNHRDSVITAD